MHATVLKHALKDLDKHQQIHRCLVLSMQTTDMVVADLVQVPYTYSMFAPLSALLLSKILHVQV